MTNTPRTPLPLTLLVRALAPPLLALAAGAQTRPWESDVTLGEGRPLELDARTAREGASLVLALEPGLALRAMVERVEATRPGGFTWFGRPVGDPQGSVALAFQDGAVAGTVRSGGRLWRVVQGERGPLVRPVDPTRFAPCGNGPEHAVGAGAGAPPATGGAGGRYAPPGPRQPVPAPTTVDVLVLWTPQAQAVVGGAAATQALVDLAFLEANTAYEESLVEIRLRCVLSALVEYTESPSMNTDLARLRAVGDGFLDVVHPLRDAVGADAVSLIVSNTNPCGVGYLMSFAPSPAFESNAFNVGSYACVTGNFTFAHELGHNFGLSHDRANTSNTPSHPFAFGYRTSDGAFRTIMAIFQGTRIQYFSNPDVSFAGQPLGIAPPAPDSAHNALALNLNAAVVSAWRPTVLPAGTALVLPGLPGGPAATPLVPGP